MEGAPKNENQESVMVKKPYHNEKGEIIGHEVGTIFREFPLSHLEQQKNKTIEFETESGNAYIIRINNPMDEEKYPSLSLSDSVFVIENTRTGTVEPISSSDISNGVLKVGEQFHWHGGNSTKVKNILFYSKGTVHSNIK